MNFFLNFLAALGSVVAVAAVVAAVLYFLLCRMKPGDVP